MVKYQLIQILETNHHREKIDLFATLRISLVNVTKSAESCGLCHIYWRNPEWKASLFAQCNLCGNQTSFIFEDILKLKRKARMIYSGQ